MRFVVATTAPAYWRPQLECIAEALRGRGHEAAVATAKPFDASKYHPADVLLCLGSGESLQPFLDSGVAPTKLLYLIEAVPTLTETDEFTRFKLAVHRRYLHQFDHIFVHTPRSIPTLVALGGPPVEALIWPHFPSLYHPLPNVDQDIDLLFLGVGSPHRRQVLRRAAARYRIAVCQTAFHADSAALYSRAKIALNIHCGLLRNFECRVIEALGCGAFLLTEALDPADVVLDGRHLITFDDRNLLERIERYLPDAENRQRIARAGHAEIQKYRLEKQIERILEVAETIHGAGLAFTPTRADQSLPPGGAPADPGPAVDDPSTGELPVNIDGQPYLIKFPKSQTIDSMFHELFVKKVYPFLPFLRALPGPIFDVGANIGCASLLFRASYPDAPIYAFEPDREAFAFLQANTACLTDIQLFHDGLFHRDASAMLYQGQVASTTNSISKSAHNTDRCEEITLRRISTFIADHAIERIRLLKIDTEGAEVPILRDLEFFLDRVSAVFLKYHSENDRLEIDRLLSDRFALCNADVASAHRGALAYVAKSVVATHTDFNKYEISRPSL